jgi:hypothetical protein
MSNELHSHNLLLAVDFMDFIQPEISSQDVRSTQKGMFETMGALAGSGTLRV